MQNTKNIAKTDVDNNPNLLLISKIYDSFEALEETLGKLKLEEPLFMTYIAKKTFAQSVYKGMERAANTKKFYKN